MKSDSKSLAPATPADYLQIPVQWSATGDPVVPYQATSGGASLSLRVNGFPDESLYTLLINGREAEAFDDWPAAWVRPNAPAAAPEDSKRSAAGLRRNSGRPGHKPRRG